MKISVVIPTYNREKEVCIAINSALSQTLKPFEIIVCDDGSTDNTGNTIKETFNTKVRFLKLSHTGLPAVTRNKGILHAQGDWIAFLDSDDIWNKYKLEKQVRYMLSNGSLACSTNAYKMLNGQNSIMLDNVSSKLKYSNLVKVNTVVTSSMLVSRELLEIVGFFPTNESYRAYEDWALWMRISTIADINLLNYPLITYTDNIKNSIRSQQVNWENIKKVLQHDVINWGLKNFKIHPRKLKLIFCIIRSTFII